MNDSQLLLSLPETLLIKYTPGRILLQKEDVTTFEAVDKENGRKLVIKKYEEAASYTGKNEERILRKLSHPNIPAFVDSFENNGNFYVVREFADGMPFDEYIREHKLSVKETTKICISVCDILLYLHSRAVPIIHRDIKPQNIIIGGDDEVYLIDFGISRFFKNGSGSDTVLSGTTAYAAPEQYGFRQTDARTDIYSLGKVLDDLISEIDTCDEKSVEYSDLCDIAERCTQFSPAKRYRNVSVLRYDLENIGKLRKERRKRRIVTGTALVAVTILLFALVFAVHSWYKNRLQPEMLPSAGELPDNTLSEMLGLDEMTEEELLSVKSIYIYGSSMTDSTWLYAWCSDGKILQSNCWNPIFGYCDAGFEQPSDTQWHEIERGEIRDISCLSKLENLERLVITYNDIKDISVLSELSNLKFIDLSGNPISDFSPLSDMASKPVGLCLRDCRMNDIWSISSLRSLEALSLSNNDLISILSIGNLSELRYCELGTNYIIDSAPLGVLLKLEYLSLVANPIEDIEFLDRLIDNRLVFLDLGWTDITDFGSLSSKRLFDYDADIQLLVQDEHDVDFSFLGARKHYFKLSLQNTDSEDFLPYLEGLEIDILFLRESGLSNLSPLAKAGYIKNLDITENPDIESLLPLMKIKGLQHVRVDSDKEDMVKKLGDDIPFFIEYVD